jgi:hypothetical protein
VIKPTPGRIVWFYPPVEARARLFVTRPEEPLAAIVARVWTDTCVNLAVFDANGNPHNFTSVLLHQGEGDRPGAGFCEWMPYQKGQAAKAEAAEQLSTEGRAIKAWNAYAECAGGRSYDGCALPTWEGLGKDRQACWMAAVAAA